MVATAIVPQAATTGTSTPDVYRGGRFEPNDFVIAAEAGGEISGQEVELVRELAGTKPELAGLLATGRCGQKPGKWAFCGVDRAGIDLNCGDLLDRYDFGRLISSRAELFSELTNTAYPIP